MIKRQLSIIIYMFLRRVSGYKDEQTCSIGNCTGARHDGIDRLISGLFTRRRASGWQTMVAATTSSSSSSHCGYILRKIYVLLAVENDSAKTRCQHLQRFEWP
jgi:hypothetical protein